MHPISIFDSQAASLRLLLQGPPGSGKSCVAGQFPGAYIIDLDRNFKSAADYLRSVGKAGSIVGIDFVDEDDKGGKVAMVGMGSSPQYARLDKLIREADANPLVQTIVLDSGTILAEILKAETMAKDGKTDMNQHLWNKFAAYGSHLLLNLASARKHVVITIHETLPKDEKKNPVYPYKVTWEGRIGERLGMYFTNVWRCKAITEWDGKQNVHKHKVYTKPDSKFELKNTLVGLPAEFEFSWEIVEKHLKPTTQTMK